MDPLKKLWELYDETMVQDKPDLSAPPASGMGSPVEGDVEHPVIVTRRKVDAARATGMETGQAHETVNGEVNLADVQQKSDLAATYGRIQDDGNRNYVKVDRKTPVPSIMAVDAELEKRDQVSPDNMRTQIPKEPVDSKTPLDTQEEYDYNMDVAYLQKYGRA